MSCCGSSGVSSMGGNMNMSMMDDCPPSICCNLFKNMTDPCSQMMDRNIHRMVYGQVDSPSCAPPCPCQPPPPPSCDNPCAFSPCCPAPRSLYRQRCIRKRGPPPSCCPSPSPCCPKPPPCCPPPCCPKPPPCCPPPSCPPPCCPPPCCPPRRPRCPPPCCPPPCCPPPCCPPPCCPSPPPCCPPPCCPSPPPCCPPPCCPSMIVRPTPVIRNRCPPPTNMSSNQQCPTPPPCCNPLPPCCVMVKPCQPRCAPSPCCPPPPGCGIGCPRPDPRCCPKPVVVSFKCPTAQCPMNPRGVEDGCSEIKCPVIRTDDCSKPDQMCMMNVCPMPSGCCPPSCGNGGGWN